MASIIPSHHHHNLSLRARGNPSRVTRISSLGCCTLINSSAGPVFVEGQCVFSFPEKSHKSRLVVVRAIGDDELQPDDAGNDNQDRESQPTGTGEVNSGFSRDDLERIAGRDDSSFCGLDLTTLMRKKYGRSYDVQLIKKEFMGRSLLAMNVMWKYREQRSFPLSEEEYLLRLDDVANTLKCWGAVSHIRNNLERSKERPRIGKVNTKKCMSAQAVQHPGKAFACTKHGLLQILTFPGILHLAAPANALEQSRSVPQMELEKNMQHFLSLADVDPTTAKLLISITGPFLSGFGFLFILRIVMSWYPKLPVGEFPYVIAYAPTEPILKATRRLIPPVGGVDVTPVVWFGLLSFLNEILVGPQGLLVLLSQQV